MSNASMQIANPLEWGWHVNVNATLFLRGMWLLWRAVEFRPWRRALEVR